MRLWDRRFPELLRRGALVWLALLCISAAACPGARAAAISFLPPVSYNVPGGGGITPADLDGDGKLDMVVTGAQGMFFFYGKGDGTFEPPTVIPIVAGWTIAADVNGDGLPDLVAGEGDSAIVMMNQGSRQFAAPVAYAVGHGPAGVAAGDFNGDGKLDLAVANIGSNNMCVLLNNGDGTFGPAVFYGSGSGARVILTADLNGDGNLDLVMGQDSSFIVYLGDGKGGFAASGNYPTGGGYPGMTLIDDFNGDGIPDVATSNTWSNNVSIFLGDGHGGFLPPTFYGTIQYPHVFASGDLDGDGAPDIAVPHNGTSAFSVLQNQGNGAFLPAVTFDAGGANTRMLGIGDFNGDGLPDVVTDNESSNTVSVLINNTPRSSPAVLSLTLDTTSPIGGFQVINGKVTLTAPAPAGGAVVTLSTNDPAVNVPPSVLVPEGQTTAGIVLGTAPVASPRRGNVTASFNGTAKRIAVSVRAPAARFLVVSPSPFTGGQPATGKVVSEVPAGPNGLLVALSSDNPAVVKVPATVTIPAGQSSVSFPVVTAPVAVPTPVVVSATAQGVATSAVLNVIDLGVPLPAVNGTAAPPVFNPANGHWYQEVQGPGLTWAQARDAAAALSYAGLPGHLATINSFNEDQFIVNNVPNSQSGSTHWVGGYQDRLAPDYSEPTGGWRWVTGEPWNYTNWNAGEPNNAGGVEDFLQWLPPGNWNDLPGAATITGYLVEYEPFIPPLLTITLSPVSAPSSPTAGGQTVTGTVTLAQPAGPNPVTIYLASDHPAAIAVPATVTVPAGQRSIPFTATVYPVSADTPVVLTADGPTANATVTVPLSGLGLPLPQTGGTGTAPVYDPANGHWYQEIQGPGLTWAQARDAAAALSYNGLPGHLATINSFNEDQFIVNNVPNSQSGTTHWIGGYQDRFAPDYSEPAGGWRWVTGEPWSFANWNAGEPNNAGGVEDSLEWLPPGNWNDLSGGATITGYLVEYEPAIPRLAPSQVTLTPNPVTGGQSSTGTVTLSQPAGPNGLTVYLNSDHPLIVVVPPSVQVPAGQSTAGFTVTTNPVSAPTIVQITADAPAGSAAAPLTVNDTGLPLPQVDGNAGPPVYNPANGHWYQEVHGPALTWPQARDAAAALSYAGLPGHLATVTSSDEVQFILNNLPDAQSGTTHWIGGYQDRFAPDYSEPAGGWHWVTGEKWDYTNWNGGEPNNAGGVEDSLQWLPGGIWNDLSGAATIAAYLVEYEPPIARIAPSQVTLAPNPVTGGQSSTGTVTLSQPAGPNGLTVYLNSDHPLVATVPPSVQVPAGQSSAGFAVTTSLVAAPTLVQITADVPAGYAAAPLTVNDTGAPLPAVNGNAAPPIYNPANGHWYQEVQGPGLTWAQARDAAAALSYAGLPGHLATITSADENQFVVNNVPDAQSGTTHWIGGYQDHLAPDYSEPTGGWRWVTGEPWSYTNWNGGEPNNAGAEDFLQWRPPGNWNDVPGNVTITGYLVEYETPIPQFAASQVAIAPNPVTGGQSATGTVTLSQAAGPKGVTVYLGSSLPNVASVPASIAVPAGQSTATFPVTTYPVSVPTPAVISASGPTGSASGSLQVTDSGVPVPSVDGAVPPVYNPANGHWYQYVRLNGRITWPDARDAAAALSYAGLPGHLATVTSEAESQFVSNYMGAFGPMGDIWIGGYQDRHAPDYSEPLGGWRWVTGEPFNGYSHWNGGEPNNAGGAEDALETNTGGGWNDLPLLAGISAYLIEYEAPPAPPAAPTTLAASTGSTTQINLSWTDPPAPRVPGDNETGFELQRKTAGGDWTKVTVTGANVQTFSDTGLTPFTHYTYRVRAVSGANLSAWSNEAGGDTGIQGQVSLSVTGPLDFGTQTVGTPSAPQGVTVTNSGNGPATITSLTLTGSNAGEFAVVPALSTPKTLAPGASGSIQLVFTPAGIGHCSATLTLADDAPGGACTLALAGTGSGPAVRLSPTALDFGPEPVGLNGSLAVLLQNNGTAPLHVSGIAFQGPNAGDFSLATDGVTGHTLQPGDISLLNVRFSPAQTGSRSATLVITDDAAGSPQSVTLTGLGTAPLLRLSADSLVFGLQAGTTTQTLTLTNNGDAPLAIDGLALTGPDASSFQIVSDSGQKSLPVGGSRTVQIAFQSATVARARRRIGAARIAAVSYSATLQIKDNDPHPTSPHAVALIANSTGANGDNSPPPPPPGFTPAGNTAPAAPSGLSAQPVSPSEIDLAWSDNSSSEQAFAIWRKDGSNDWRRIALVLPNATRFADRGLTPGTTYTYRVRATAGSLASDWSSEVTAALLPAAPSGLTATALSPGEIDLTWTGGAGDETAIALFRQTGSGPWQRLAELQPGLTRYVDRSVQPGTSYAYRVRTHDSTQVSAWSNTAPVATPPLVPAAPDGLTAAALSPSEIDLTWTAGSGSETALALFRQSGSGAWQRIAELKPVASSYADRSVQPGVSYHYRVRSHDNTQVSGWSNEAPAATPLLLPGGPASLTVRAASPHELDLSWTSSGTGATGLAIWRQTGSGPWQRLAELLPSARGYADRSVQAGTSYRYRVRAHSSVAVSAWTNEVGGVTPAGQ